MRFNLRGRVLHAIRGLSLDVHAGESLAIVGESGCGKSVLNKNLIGLPRQQRLYRRRLHPLLWNR